MRITWHSISNALSAIFVLATAAGWAPTALGQDVITEIMRICSDRHTPGWWQCRMNCPMEGEKCGLACNEKYLRPEASALGKKCAARQGAAWGLMEESLAQIERQRRSDLDALATSCIKRHSPDMVEALVCASRDRAWVERRLDEAEKAMH